MSLESSSQKMVAPKKNALSKQSKQLTNHLQKHPYLYLKDIVVYVKSTLWGISYSLSAVTN
jgi:hypothetical protein